MSGPTTLICTRLADMTVMHPLQTETTCKKCGCAVGVYPTGQRAMQMYPDMEVLCVVCAALTPIEGGEEIEIRPAGTWEEVVQETHESKPVGKA